MPSAHRVSALSSHCHAPPFFSAWKYTPSVTRRLSGEFISHTSRNIPAPEYQRVFGDMCRTSTPISFTPLCRKRVISASKEV